jgi:hypothetical protein
MFQALPVVKKSSWALVIQSATIVDKLKLEEFI